MIKKLHVSKNLFDATMEQGTITQTGDIAADNRIRTKEYIDIDSEYITLSWGNDQATEAFMVTYDANGNFVNFSNRWFSSPSTKQLLSNEKKIRIVWRYTSQADITPSAVNSVMLVSGQTPLPYEPYGNTWNTKSYAKIVDTTQQVISFPVVVRPMENTIPSWTIKGNMTQDGTPSPSNVIYPSECGDLVNGNYILPIKTGVTTNVNLNETQSTRKIKKYEITGLEGWILRSGTPENEFFCERQGTNFVNNAAICSHYANQDSGSFADLQDKHFIIRIAASGDKTYFGIRDSSYPSTNEGAMQLRSYFQQQYAAGTPVTVWYVLATPETAIVNEPIRKIGEYADSVSGTNLAVTAQSPTTIDVDTSLKPSEMDLTYTGTKMCKRKRKSANLFDGKTSETDKRISISTGGSYNAQGYSISEYIPITGGTKYIVNTSYYCYYALYDANKDFIYGNIIRNDTAIPAAYSNARFVRFDFASDDIGGIMLNTGGTALPYVPYWE